VSATPSSFLVQLQISGRDSFDLLRVAYVFKESPSNNFVYLFVSNGVLCLNQRASPAVQVPTGPDAPARCCPTSAALCGSVMIETQLSFSETACVSSCMKLMVWSDSVEPSTFTAEALMQ